MSDGKIDAGVWRVAGVVLLAPIMTNLDATIVNVALSTIREDLHASIATVQWTVSGYLLALALMLPMNGWLIDRLGAKRVFLACVSAFTLASLLCGAARTVDQLIAFRVLQGAAGGLLTPMTQLMLARVAGKNLARVMGYTSMPVLVVPVLGPVIAGAILHAARWPWLFYLNVPIGALALTLAWIFLPSDSETLQKRPFDLLGFAVLSPGLVALLYGLDAGPGGGRAVALLGGAALVATFIVRARRKGPTALIDLALFRNGSFSVAATVMFWFNAVTLSGSFLLPLFFIAGCGQSPRAAGVLLAPLGAGMMCVVPFLGTLTDKLGCRRLCVAGAILALAGTLPLVWLSQDHFTRPLAFACMFVRGLGLGAVGIPAVSAAYASVPRERLAIATTAANIVQRLGGPIATTVLAMVLASSVVVVGPRAFTFALAALAAIHLFALITATRLPLSLVKK